MPKPNTRFLRNIIKDTNTHNAALLAKEAAESQARLERLEKVEERRSAKPGDIRKRQIGSINAILGNKRSGRDSREGSSSARESRRDMGSSSRRRSRSPGEGRERTRHRDRRDEGRDKHRPEGRISHARRRERCNDSPDEDHGSRHGPSRRRSRSPSARERRHRQRSTSRHRHSRSNRDPDRRHEVKEDAKSHSTSDMNIDASDSDPLDDFIGPAPPPKSPIRTRGRGTISAFSGIDRRFAAGYDPKLDVEENTEANGVDDQWADAVEAFRDRQKLKAAQEERMKAAGFSEEDVGRWKDGGREKTEADVKWAKKGEEREWDVGKALGAD